MLHGLDWASLLPGCRTSWSSQQHRHTRAALTAQFHLMAARTRQIGTPLGWHEGRPRAGPLHRLVTNCSGGSTSERSRNGCEAEPPRAPHIVLGVPYDATRSEARQAYWARIKELHPDASGSLDTTAAMVEVNIAYDQLSQGNRSRARDSDDDGERPSVFDVPEGEPTCMFVNPFACNVSPLDWRQLQDVVVGQEDDPQAALQAAGLFFSYDTAVVWVTPGQLQELTVELTAMEASMAVELTAYYVQDCLLRARASNERMPFNRPG